MSKILLCSILCSLGLSTCSSHTLVEKPVELTPPHIEQNIDYNSVVIHEKALTYIEKEKEPTYVYTTTNLNVRIEPNLEGRVVETLPQHTKLEQVEIVNYEWIMIKVDDCYYYVNINYVTEEEPEKTITLEKLEPAKYSIEKEKNTILFEEYLGEYTLTAYCACEKCCGKWSKYKKTASGTTPEEGRTVACVSLDFGTVININGEDYIVEDTGHLKDNQIDIYFESHQEALEFGRQKGEVYLINHKRK